MTLRPRLVVDLVGAESGAIQAMRGGAHVHYYRGFIRAHCRDGERRTFQYRAGGSRLVLEVQ